MEFGRLPESELGKVDFTLPKEPAFNETILTGKKAAHPEDLCRVCQMGKKRMGRKNLS